MDIDNEQILQRAEEIIRAYVPPSVDDFDGDLAIYAIDIISDVLLYSLVKGCDIDLIVRCALAHLEDEGQEYVAKRAAEDDLLVDGGG